MCISYEGLTTGRLLKPNILERCGFPTLKPSKPSPSIVAGCVWRKQAKDKKIVQKAIRESGNQLIQILKEEIFLCEITGDLERFGNLVFLLNHHTAYELMKSLKDAGLSKDITRLADKAGKRKKP